MSRAGQFRFLLLLTALPWIVGALIWWWLA